MTNERITRDKYGLDEIVLNGVDIHLERMDADHVWIGIYRHNGDNQKRVSVSLLINGRAIHGSIDENDFGLPITAKDQF